MKTNSTIVFATIFIVFSLCITPIAFIWSINALFHLNIDYTIENVIASIVLLIIFSVNSGYIKKS